MHSTSLLFLGASITSGFGLPKELSFPYRIQQFLKEQGSDIIILNAAVPGATSPDGILQLRSHLQTDTKYLVIALGLGDLFFAIPPEQTEQHLLNVIHEAKTMQNGLKIFLFANEFFQLAYFPFIEIEQEQQFKEMFPRVAKNTKSILLPFMLKDVANQLHLNQDDMLHPNEQGMEIVTNNVWHSLKNYLL